MKNFTVTALFVLLFCPLFPSSAEPVSTDWGGKAEIVYDTGFMHMLMKHPDGGVCLFNMELVENDAPGAGFSEKGPGTDTIWGKTWGRKILHLDDPRAEKAWLVIFVNQLGKTPLRFRVKGTEKSLLPWDLKQCREMYRWVEFPVDWLKKGNNVIDFYCPDAPTEEEGWELYLSCADEFEAGGGDPADVGKTSYKSTNGGESWKQSPFGPLGQTRAEYSIRLSLDRYITTGWLASPVIDLWKGDSQDFIVPLREIQTMKLSIRSEVPPDTKIEYYYRKGTDPGPFSENWEPYQYIGEGQVLDFETGGADLNRRYIQFKAVLSTANPLSSPIIKSARVTAELNERIPLHDNIRVISIENPVIKYSSINWEWEKWDRPEFKDLKTRENLDEVIAGSRSEFDAQVKILDYVSGRWQWQIVSDNYPGWDALSILTRTENRGFGGMCIHFNNVIGGMCMAYGWQARIVNIVAHEIVEVWNDDYGKWIMLDGAFDPENGNTYQYDPETAEPMNMLELHRRYLEYYYPDHAIDWMNDFTGYMELREGEPVPVKRGSLTHNRGRKNTGFITAAFMRMVPRNNWYEKPYPRPLNHGTSWWPWDGYVNWYDSRTPPKRQYSWHTDRPCDMWPDLNLVHVDATSGFGNDRLFLRFETYTPNFSHFEINVDDTGWKKSGERWTWLLQSGQNILRARAVNKLGAKGKPSVIVINHADAPFGE